MKDLLVKLRDSPEFAMIMTELVKTRPVIPEYAPAKTRDEDAQLMKRIGYQSGMQKGFDLLFQSLTGKRP